jgi:hypothetical protein
VCGTVCLVVMLLLGCQTASAGPLRRIAGPISAFQTDWSRWAIWQTPGSNSIEVLDLADGHLHTVSNAFPQSQHASPYASLEREEEEPDRSNSSGMFLQDSTAFDPQTGQVELMPASPYTYGWIRIGRRYAEGEPRACPFKGCVPLLDLATGAVSIRHGPQLFDLDRASAPPEQICPRLRRKVLSTLKRYSGVSGLYENGVLVEYGELQQGRSVEIDHCHGRQIVLQTGGEPIDLDLQDDLVTWDTGDGADASEPAAGGELSAYSLSAGSRRNWRLPAVPISGEGLTFPAPVTAGYSAHVDSTVFWVADIAVTHESESPEPEEFSLYASRF